LPAETLAVRKEVRAFADAVLQPIAWELNCTPERRDGFRHDVFRNMAHAQLFTIPFPTDVGGRGLVNPTLATLVVLEELAYYSPGIASALYDAQAILVGNTLNRAPDHLRSHYLPRLVKGEFVGSFATSEPGASTDLSVKSVKTTARRGSNRKWGVCYAATFPS
jgi:alkylation response protein AidB-like acyl-CoA dehydrogenase